MSDEIAARLYGGPTPSAQLVPASSTASAPAPDTTSPPEAPQPKSLDDIAHGLYGPKSVDQAPVDKPANREAVLKMRDTPERRMYPAERTFASVPVEAWLNPQLSPEERAAAAREMRETYADMSLRADEARDLHAVVDQITEQVTPETVQKWQGEAANEAVQRYGAAADEKLALAVKLVRRDPSVVDFLEKTGLGNHPRFVSKFIELAERERAKGRL